MWHTFAENMWSNLPVENFLSPQFSGQAWIQVPKAAPKPPKKKTTPTQQPTQPGQPGQGHHHHSPTPSFGPSTPTTSTPSPPVSQSPSTPPTGNPTTPGVVPVPGGGAGNAGATQVTSSAREAGIAFGGAGSVLPGSLLWVRISRRRRRRRHSGTAG
jgi:hypothetical protein